MKKNLIKSPPTNETASVTENENVLALRGWLLVLVLVTLVVVISYLWFDVSDRIVHSQSSSSK
jgi:hypothetical protein